VIKTYDTIFLDRDGTLNPDPGYIRSLDQFTFFDFTLPALELLAEQGNRFCIVTNQSGVGRGLIHERDLAEIHDYIRDVFQEHHIPLLAIYYCPDHPEQATSRRKPGDGMFREAAEEHGIHLERCLMIGDAGSDILAGQNLGMDTMLVLTGGGRTTLGQLSRSPTYIAENLWDGAQQLLGVKVP
jgi:D,D-heptose 1,7-bisphosphate phosphatase